MLDAWSNWVFSSRFRRRTLIRAWRVLLRVQRATLADAVLVVRQQDGRILAVHSASGALRLPHKELDGWRAVTTQVEEWLEELLEQRKQPPKLEAIEGTPGPQRVTFVYSAEACVPAVERGSAIWLDLEMALPTLTLSDLRLLLLSKPLIRLT